jgi:hypothetical protein
MDRILFGDNQFFAVNHMSEEKARAQAMRFKDTKAIIDVLDIAYDLGIKTFMCTTYDRISEVCDHIRAHPTRYKDYKIYPCMPYAYKYANAVSQIGVMGTLKKFAPGSMVETIFRGGMAAVRMDFVDLMKLLVDAEMKMFRGINTEVIFLQNVVTDLILGLGMKEFFTAFSRHIKEKYHAEVGFITMNMPRLLEVLEECGIENPIICSNINKIGFRMCGGIETYEKIIREKKFRPIAMSVLASGAIPPREALEYVCGLKNVESIVFGASSRAHIKETKDLIDNLSPPCVGAGQ